LEIFGDGLQSDLVISGDGQESKGSRHIVSTIEISQRFLLLLTGTVIGFMQPNTNALMSEQLLSMTFGSIDSLRQLLINLAWRRTVYF
jgi:hypothetical protein